MATNWDEKFFESTRGQIVTRLRRGGLTVEIRNPWPVGVARTMPIPGAGMGIIGLAERTTLTGGRLEHGRTPAGEFRLWAWLPWPT